MDICRLVEESDVSRIGAYSFMQIFIEAFSSMQSLMILSLNEPVLCGSDEQ